MLTESRTDELVLGALTELVENAPPSVAGTDSYFKIEVIREEELDLDIAVTGRFLRWSMPYERVELDAKHDSPAFVQPAETVAFDKQWFDDADDAVVAIAATEEPAVRKSSWIWLPISIAVAGIAVAIVSLI